MLLVKVMVQLYHPVIAVTGGSNRAEKVIRRRRQAADQIPGPEATWTNQLCGERAGRHIVFLQNSQGIIHIGI